MARLLTLYEDGRKRENGGGDSKGGGAFPAKEFTAGSGRSQRRV